MAKKPETPKSSKIAFFVRVADANGTLSFFPATDHIGKVMPFEKPQATCAMQVKDDNVAFSLLHLSRMTATKVAHDVIQFPRGPLERLARHAALLTEPVAPATPLSENEVVVVVDDTTYHLSLTRDDAGVGRLELESIDGQEAEDGVWPEVFELPRSAMRLDLYLRSPRVPRTLAVGFIGHLGKPGDPDTVSRCAAKVLNSIAQLSEFRILSGLEAVSVPAGPSKWAQQAAALRKVEKDVATEVPVWLFTTPTPESPDPALVAAGSVVVTIDMENASSSAGKLLCHYTPSASIEEIFEQYRPVFDDQISIDLRQILGTEQLADLTYHIILGEVDANVVESLETALKGLKPLDLTTSQVRHHPDPDAA